MRKLTTAMVKISRGDLNQEVVLASNDEIGDMARTFNFMTRGLREKQLIENFARDLSFSIEIKKISDMITERITTALGAQQGFLLLCETVQSDHVHLLSSFPLNREENVKIICEPELHQHFLKVRKTVPMNFLKSYPGFYRQLSRLNRISELKLIIPILLKEHLIGIIVLGEKIDKSRYTTEEKTFLETLVNQASFAIESALLYEELAEQERLKYELEIARKVQQSLLPQHSPQLTELSIDGICIPATEVGGDYFDYLVPGDGQIGIAIADVMGKGSSAAFYMAVIKGMMLSLAPICPSPADLLKELNRRLFGNMEKNSFVTMTYAIFDYKNHKLTFARAGHSSLIQRKHNSSTAEIFTPDGIGLGLNEGRIFDETIEEVELPYSPGDFYVFFTDGITEALNEEKTEFSEQRLVETVKHINEEDAGDIQNIIIKSIQQFVGNSAQHDDITLVTVKINSA